MNELNFTDDSIERHEHIRLNAAALDKLMRGADARFLQIQQGRVQTIHGEHLALAWLSWADVRVETERGAEIVFLGEYEHLHRFSLIPVEAPQTIETRPRDVKPDGDFVGVFHVATTLPSAEAQLVVMAAHFANWINRTRHCGRCGSPMIAKDGGHRRECTSDTCKWQEFPRTDPVVLTLVTKGDRCILGRQPRFPKGFYSPLAGFVSPAETIEGAVRREVGEEVGVKVGRVTYLASQPWPFPGSLMMGFVSEALTDELTVDKAELEDAQWFTRAEVEAIARNEEVRGMKLHLPPKGVVARLVIEHWLAEGAGVARKVGMNPAAQLWLSGIGKAATIAVDTLLPARCLRCGAVVGETGALCAKCWEGMSFITAPQCDQCGQPFEVDLSTATLCAACMADPPGYDRARSVFRYDDASRALVLRFKHGDRTGATPHFARWMARAGGALLADADLIVPVPLHPWRLWRRRYNQAAMLAVAIAKQADKACIPDALARTRATPSQGRLGRGQRQRNVKGAFQLRRPDAVDGKRVILIDDVLTTGATVEECVRILRRGGAEHVDVLTLARVVLTPDFEIAESSLYS